MHFVAVMISDGKNVDENDTNSTSTNKYTENCGGCVATADSQAVHLQVELSHASVTDQPTIYEGSSDENAFEYGIRVFCCDFVSVLFLFVAASFLVLCGFDHIPSLTHHFKTHPHDKVTVLAVTGVTIALVFFILLFRCVRRVCVVSHSSSPSLHDSCCESLRKRKARKMYDRFKRGNDQINGGERTIAPPPPQNILNDWTPGLADLSDAQLEDVRNILSTFLTNHDSGDWLFSPSSVSSISRRGGFAENQKFDTAKENIKLKLGIKLILVGQPNVGKTSVFHRILYDRFSEYYMATLGADLAHVCLHLYPGQPKRHLMVNLQLWDIAGSERFSDLSHIVYRDATAFIVVCDITLPGHLKQAEPWVADIMQLRYEPYVALFLNKLDIKSDQFSRGEDGSNGMLDRLDQFAVSAKTGEKVLENVLQVLIKSTLHEIDKLV